MVDRIQTAVKPRLQWSLLLAVLLGLCSISSPHLLSHAHAHHGTPVRSSRSGHGPVRSRSGSGSLETEHGMGAVSAAAATLIPHTPQHDTLAVAIPEISSIAPAMQSVRLPIAQAGSALRLLAGESYLGRAPPTA